MYDFLTIMGIFFLGMIFLALFGRYIFAFMVLAMLLFFGFWALLIAMVIGLPLAIIAKLCFGKSIDITFKK